MDCNAFISALGASSGLTDLVLDADGQTAIKVDDTLRLTFSTEGDYRMACRVSLMDTTDFCGDMADLLAANLDVESCGGGALAIDESVGEIVYVRFVATKALSQENQVRTLVTEIIKMASFWATYLPTLTNTAAKEVNQDPHEGVMLRL